MKFRIGSVSGSIAILVVCLSGTPSANAGPGGTIGSVAVMNCSTGDCSVGTGSSNSKQFNLPVVTASPVPLPPWATVDADLSSYSSYSSQGSWLQSTGGSYVYSNYDISYPCYQITNSAPHGIFIPMNSPGEFKSFLQSRFVATGGASYTSCAPLPAPCAGGVSIGWNGAAPGCSGTIPAGSYPSGNTASLSNSAGGLSGTATATCSNGSWSAAGACSSTGCTGGVSVGWNGADSGCSGTIPTGTYPNGASASVSNSASGLSGTATASCSNGSWSASGTCAAGVPTVNGWNITKLLMSFFGGGSMSMQFLTMGPVPAIGTPCGYGCTVIASTPPGCVYYNVTSVGYGGTQTNICPLSACTLGTGGGAPIPWWQASLSFDPGITASNAPYCYYSTAAGAAYVSASTFGGTCPATVNFCP